MMEKNLELIQERYELAMGRIGQLVDETETAEEFSAYFKETAVFLQLMDAVYQKAVDGSLYRMPLAQKEQLNRSLYEELLGENYEKSNCNPSYAAKRYGKEYGPYLAALRAELRSLIAYAYEKEQYAMLIRMELFLEIYGWFCMDARPAFGELKESMASFAFDYQEEFMEEAVRSSFTLQNSYCKEIVCHADLFSEDYLYDYGEYISENEKKLAAYMAKLPQETIDLIADTFTEGYRKGFEMTGKDISIKKTVNIRYFIGFERVVRAAVKDFEALGLSAILCRAQPSFLLGRNVQKVGVFSAQPNKQFECDHEYDKVLYFNSMFVNRKLECYKAALEHYKKEAGVFGGPAVIEDFGELPFVPQEKEEAYRFSEAERKLAVEYAAKAGMLLNQYVKGEERSFTIIAFPIPAIGEKFEEIFEKTIQLNTLHYETYQKIQQTLIDALDQAEYAIVKGKNGNETDLRIHLWKLQDPETETIFENCVADVNIPVGEVFTSPILQGTNGMLHVSEVFLNGLQFKNLKLEFQEGMICTYDCSNFADAASAKRYIKDHVLHQHETLPMGEFAIGTNTVAYQMAREYGIGNVLPILIAEKTGPHFAVGDTCYSHEEDMVTYNPDKKKIVARENEVSAKRREDMAKAYFNCHTDITIPYDEIGELSALRADGSKIEIIADGRFVLAGCEELNIPLNDAK